jgi:hypothetical protein
MLCIYLYMNMAFWSVSWAQIPAYWVYIKKEKRTLLLKELRNNIKAGILTLTWVVEAVANEQGWAQIWVWEREWTERVRKVKRSMIDIDFWWLFGPKKWSHDYYHIEYCPYGDSRLGCSHGIYNLNILQNVCFDLHIYQWDWNIKFWIPFPFTCQCNFYFEFQVHWQILPTHCPLIAHSPTYCLLTIGCWIYSRLRTFVFWPI